MNTAAVVTQIDLAETQLPAGPVQGTQDRGDVVTSNTPAPSLDVRVKQVKTVIKAITKERKFKGETRKITYWEVRVGSVVSKVYSTPSGKRELFTLAYWVDGRRKREVFPTKDEAIWDYIAAENPAAAERCLRGIDAQFETLAIHPLMGRSREDLAPGLRSFAVGNYVIFYRSMARKAGVQIVRVIEGHRNITPEEF